ncbi:hypothetical protein L208DRAFT_1416096, partial [Tricholoma matsutake]
VRLEAGGALLSPVPVPGHCSTHDPPHKQLLMRLGVGGLLSLLFHPCSTPRAVAH